MLCLSYPTLNQNPKSQTKHPKQIHPQNITKHPKQNPKQKPTTGKQNHIEKN